MQDFGIYPQVSQRHVKSCHVEFSCTNISCGYTLMFRGTKVEVKCKWFSIISTGKRHTSLDSLFLQIFHVDISVALNPFTTRGVVPLSRSILDKNTTELICILLRNALYRTIATSYKWCYILSGKQYCRIGEAIALFPMLLYCTRRCFIVSGVE